MYVCVGVRMNSVAHTHTDTLTSSYKSKPKPTNADPHVFTATCISVFTDCFALYSQSHCLRLTFSLSLPGRFIRSFGHPHWKIGPKYMYRAITKNLNEHKWIIFFLPANACAAAHLHSFCLVIGQKKKSHNQTEEKTKWNKNESAQ